MYNSDIGRDKSSSSTYNDNNSKGSLSSCFFSLSPKQFSLLSSIIGIFLIDNLDIDQQNSLGNFIVNIGQAILTSASQEQLNGDSE
jgi:hypothetical protein